MFIFLSSSFFCDNLIHFIPEIYNFFYIHKYFEWFIMITLVFIKLIISKVCEEQHSGMPFSCIDQIGIICWHISSIWFSHNYSNNHNIPYGNIEMIFFLFFLPYWNYSEIYLIEEKKKKTLNFYWLIHQTHQKRPINFRVEPLYKDVQGIHSIVIFSKATTVNIIFSHLILSEKLYNKL